MKVLVACEESQRVCTSFRELGHEAYSCDVQEPGGGHPEWHILGDALMAIRGGIIQTMDGAEHDVGRWDLIIGHPPCTYLTAASAVRLYAKGQLNQERLAKLREAAAFFRAILDADCDKICVENPVPLHIAELPPYSQVIQPYMFGDPWLKKTCLWLKGLPPLFATDTVEPQGYWIGAHGHDKAKRGMSKGFRDQKTRSKTFWGIARAMAEQFGGDIREKKGEEIPNGKFGNDEN